MNKNQYINLSDECIQRVEDKTFIPKSKDNRDYLMFLEQMADGVAELISLDPETATEK
jgi:hypothetical protein